MVHALHPPTLHCTPYKKVEQENQTPPGLGSHPTVGGWVQSTYQCWGENARLDTRATVFMRIIAAAVIAVINRSRNNNYQQKGKEENFSKDALWS